MSGKEPTYVQGTQEQVVLALLVEQLLLPPPNLALLVVQIQGSCGSAQEL